MSGKSDFQEYIKAFFDGPITIIFLILDLLGVGAVFLWVIDGWEEAIAVSLFLIALHFGSYAIFKKQRGEIRALTKSINDFTNTLPKPILSLSDNNTESNVLIMRIPSIPPELNYDELISIERQILLDQYNSYKEEILTGLSATVLLQEGIKKDTKEFKKDCENYLDEYRNYLQNSYIYSLREKRLKLISFNLDYHKGNKPIQDVIVIINFPENLKPLQGDLYHQLIIFNEPPTPPKKPSITKKVFPDFAKESSLFYNILPKDNTNYLIPENIRGPHIEDKTVKYEVDKLMHNFSIKLEEVPVLIKDEHIQKTWTLEYSIHATELPNPIQGKLYLEITQE